MLLLVIGQTFEVCRLTGIEFSWTENIQDHYLFTLKLIIVSPYKV